MSGHSKWHSIRHKKAVVDAKRGKQFAKLIKEITVAARLGGGDTDANPRLRTAITSAKAMNMPADNIKRSIQRGTGELEGVQYEEVVYEGYGPGGVAVFVEALTDNKNRTVAELRHVFTKHGGNLSEPGSVAWMFSKKGIFMVEEEAVGEDRLMEVALEAGADDISLDEGAYEVTCPWELFASLREALGDADIPTTLAEVIQAPQSTIKLEGSEGQQVLRLMEGLEDHDDVQNVSANFDIPAEVMEEVGA
ncbi:MAG: YebC/PmpR family DNA-binding transcriptional regulator [Nitrospinae bacterium]|nr:YebC/PmpR family DNA-binding transcriptional regulator [Nitrospinota bacterium]